MQKCSEMVIGQPRTKLNMRTAAVTVCVALIALLPETVVGQDIWPASLEISIGSGSGRTTGEYLSNGNGIALDVVAGVGLRPLPAGRLFLAASFAAQGPVATDAVCIIGSNGDCIPGFPTFNVTSALAGWETRDGAARLLVGPAYIRADRAVMGWHAHGSLFMLRAWRLSLGLMLRGTLVPNYQGDSFRLVAGGITLRVR